MSRWQDNEGKLRTWEISGSLPPEPHPTAKSGGVPWMYSKNILCFVVTSTMERALELARKQYPLARFHTAAARGRVDYIDDAVPGVKVEHD